MPRAQLVSFEDYQAPTQQLAVQLELPVAKIMLHRFPDGESQIRLPELETDHLIVCRSLDNPNDKLIELMLLSQTARDMGIKTLTLVAPYLCYMRQDIAFHKGEAISQKIIGKYLAGLFNNIVTVDPHLHRTPQLASAVPCEKAIHLTATPALADFLVSHHQAYVLIGPDEESEQWVSAIARRGGFDYGIATKQRLADRQVEITLPEIDITGKPLVLVDDMISTGHTMLETANRLFAQGAASIHCLVTHALHDDSVAKMLLDAGIKSIWSTDSILRQVEQIQLAPLIAEGMQPLLD